MKTLLCLAIAVLTVSSLSAAEDWVWWEAESAKEQNFDPNHSFMPKNEKLSEGEWIGVGGERDETTFAEYEIEVPEAGEYQFYVRKFWKHGPFRYRFGEGEWVKVGRDVALLDSVSLRQHLSANWVDLGKVELQAGPTTFRIELLEQDGAAAFDAFLISKTPYNPRGTLKPGEKYNRAPDGWFSFEPDRDLFEPTPIDMRSLNETVAGENGFIEQRGDQFVHGKTDEPVKFWAVNINHRVLNMSRADIDHLARGYAKRGINLVRYHGPIFSKGPEADPKILDRLFYTVAAMKNEGIYFHLSIYFQHWNTMKESQGRSVYLKEFGYEDGGRPFALHFINRDFQEIMKGWWKALLTQENPYTGQALAKDPAVMGAELINEDNYFFFTFSYDQVPGQQMEILEKRFGDWAAEKHGSVAAAVDVWGEKHERDDVEAGRLGLYNAWQMGNQDTKRARATAEFLARDERQFFAGMSDYLKEDLGFGGVVTATNWKTASNETLEPVEKWANAGVDFMDHHGYFGRPFQEKNKAFGFGAGDQYRNRSAARFDPGKVEDGEAPRKSFDLPFNILVWDHLPHMISEVAWPVPNRFRGEQALLGSLLGTLQGLDAIVWFATESSAWSGTLSSQWPIQVPSQAGQWPAAARIFRQQLIQQAEPSVQVRLGEEAVFDLQGMPVTQSANLDSMQAKVAEGAGGKTEGTAEDGSQQLAFFVGPVTVDFQPGDQIEMKSVDLDQYIDMEAQTVRSQTGELVWNWGDGLVTADAPKAQVAVGFLGDQGVVELSEMRVSTDLEYGVFALVPLDDKPVADSDQLLLQVFSEDSNYGWEETVGDDGWITIESVGSAPIVIKNLAGTVNLERPDAKELKVTALDFNGYPKQEVGTADEIQLQPSTLYYLIER